MRRCWHGRSHKPFDIVAINAGLVSVKFDSILGTLDDVVQYGARWNTVDGNQLDRGFAPCGNNSGRLGGQIPSIKDCGLGQVVWPVRRHLGLNRGDACFDRQRPGGKCAVVIGKLAPSSVVPCICASLPQPPLQNPL